MPIHLPLLPIPEWGGGGMVDLWQKYAKTGGGGKVINELGSPPSPLPFKNPQITRPIGRGQLAHVPLGSEDSRFYQESQKHWASIFLLQQLPRSCACLKGVTSSPRLWDQRPTAHWPGAAPASGVVTVRSSWVECLCSEISATCEAKRRSCSQDCNYSVNVSLNFHWFPR